MPHSIIVRNLGGPESLQYIKSKLTSPGPGEVQVKQSAIGLNYIDVYHRTGFYPLGNLPAGIGMEAAGVVNAIGTGVTEFKEGDRIAYATLPPGAYTTMRNISADRIVKLPDDISERQGAAMMLQGMTVQYLIRRTYPVKPGQIVLFHAAAGGVGLIACQWLKHIGATVIGTVGSEEKAEIAKTHGCDHTILYKREKVVDKVMEITNGAGVPVVYDAVGKDTFEISINSLSPMGMLANFGNASGPVPPFDPMILSRKGSLFYTRPSLMTYTAKHEDMVSSAEELFEVVRAKAVKIEIGQTYRLENASKAHYDLESRKTIGSTILLP